MNFVEIVLISWLLLTCFLLGYVGYYAYKNRLTNLQKKAIQNMIEKRGGLK